MTKLVKWYHPEKITPRFRVLIQGACDDMGIYLPVTNDWRDVGNLPSGASKTSRHFFGEGVDFDIPLKGHGALVGPFLVALIKRAIAMGVLYQLEVEIVASVKDSHLHVALDPSQKVPTIFATAD